MVDVGTVKKHEIIQLIDRENGKGFYKNIDLSGYTFYKKESFINFKIVDIKDIKVVVIKYIYVTNKSDLIKLLSFCVNFWSVNDIGFIYYLEHKRKQNYIKKYLPLLGFSYSEYEKEGVWKYKFKSTNGFRENELVEVYL